MRSVFVMTYCAGDENNGPKASEEQDGPSK